MRTSRSCVGLRHAALCGGPLPPMAVTTRTDPAEALRRLHLELLEGERRFAAQWQARVEALRRRQAARPPRQLELPLR